MRRAFIILFLLAVAPAGWSVDLQTGLNGTWYDPAQDGQGFVIHIIPDADQVFVAWFTYEQADGRQMWLTGSGSLSEQPLQLELLRPTGGALADGSAEPELARWGSGTLDFTSCTGARFTYQQDGGSSGEVVIERLTPSVGCQEAGQ